MPVSATVMTTPWPRLPGGETGRGISTRRPPSREGVGGVGDEIGDDLADLAVVGVDGRWAPQIADSLDALQADTGFEEREDGVDKSWRSVTGPGTRDGSGGSGR